MYLGMDLGTSGVKVVLVDEAQSVVGQITVPLDVSRPHPLWSEQNPEDWWSAASQAMDRLKTSHPAELSAVRGIGLSGQMHGATLLGASDEVLRPAILWNDGRSSDACRELERRLPAISEITGNRVMPGFTAPKLLWVAEHEPHLFERVACVLLPKDYLRLRLSGERAAEMSDASGTLWLDVARRSWSNDALEATGLSAAAMPRLCEGSDATGQLSPDLARRWGMGPGVVIAGGAGDQAAGAIGVGVVQAGEAFLALGTSGVLFVAGEAYAPNPKAAVHAFCHCLPQRWHQMSVILSAASCLAWVTRLTGAPNESVLVGEVEQRPENATAPLFLPYLSGERTPHDDPHAAGVFFGLAHEHERADLAYAVLEGVAFALADGQAALEEGGTPLAEVAVIGGGARSLYWGRILSSVLGCSLRYPDYEQADADVGPAFGAARLGRLAATAEDVAEVCVAPPTRETLDPDPALRSRSLERYETYKRLYPALRESFRALC